MYDCGSLSITLKANLSEGNIILKSDVQERGIFTDLYDDATCPVWKFDLLAETGTPVVRYELNKIYD